VFLGKPNEITLSKKVLIIDIFQAYLKVGDFLFLKDLTNKYYKAKKKSIQLNDGNVVEIKDFGTFGIEIDTKIEEVTEIYIMLNTLV
jgi:hypothetical protein